MTASRFALRRLRSPQELQEAAATLRRNGFTQSRDGTWSRPPENPMTDDDIAASNQRVSDYWQSVGGHPDAGYQDVPKHYICEDCPNAGTPYNDESVIIAEDAEEAGWAECQHCEEWFCPKHHVAEKGGCYEVCFTCREQQEIDAVSVED